MGKTADICTPRIHRTFKSEDWIYVSITPGEEWSYDNEGYLVVVWRKNVTLYLSTAEFKQYFEKVDS